MKLVVFDIDGTLLDNLAAEDECFVQALRDGLGLNAVSPEWETYQHVSDHGIAIETYRREFGAAPLPDAVADTIGRFVALLAAAYHSQPISPIPGAGELLASLPSHGWAIAMATGAWRRAAHFKLTAAGLRDDAIPLATSEDGPARTDIVKAAVARAERHYDASTVSSRWATACGTWMPPEWTRVLGNLVFLNGAPASSVAPFNIVTWSLFYEMTFYLAFPLLLIALRNRIAVTSLGFLGPVLAVLAGADTLVLCWSLLFAGVALAFAREAWPRIPGIIVVTSYLAITTLAALDALPPVAAILAFGVVAGSLVKSCVSDANIVARLLEWAPLRALGRVSYSFYLVHWMIVVLVARAVEHASAVIATTTIFLGGFALSAIAAAVLWWVAERPYFVYARHPA